MNRLLNLYTIIGFILIINLGTLAVLRFGNPQWHKWIYVFQANYSPGTPDLATGGQFPPENWVFLHGLDNYTSIDFWIVLKPPQDFNGTWTHWGEYGQLLAEFKFNNGNHFITFEKNPQTGNLFKTWEKSPIK